MGASAGPWRMRSASLLFLVSVSLFACSSSDETAGGASGSGGPSGSSGSSSSGGTASKPACADADATFETTVEWFETKPGAQQVASWSIDAVVDAGDAASVLAHREVANKTVELAFFDAKGTAKEIAKLADVTAYGVRAAAFVDGGKRCAAYVFSGGKTLRVACDDGTNEDTGVKADGDRALIPLVQPDGTISVFTDSFASYAEVRRENGKWRNDEKYESSISWPEDSVLYQGEPLTCFIDQGDRAAIEGSIGRVAGTAAAGSCRLAAGERGAFVLTDKGFAEIPWTSFASGKGATYETTPVTLATKADRLVVAGDKPFALVVEGGKVQRVALPSGTPSAVVDLADTSGLRTSFDAKSGTLRVVSTKTDTASAPTPSKQRFRVATRCASTW